MDKPGYINRRGLTCSIICFTLYGMTYALPSLLPLMISGYEVKNAVNTTKNTSTLSSSVATPGYNNLENWGPGLYDSSDLASSAASSPSGREDALFTSIYLYANVLQNVGWTALIAVCSSSMTNYVFFFGIVSGVAS